MIETEIKEPTLRVTKRVHNLPDDNSSNNEANNHPRVRNTSVISSQFWDSKIFRTLVLLLMIDDAHDVG